MIIFLDPVSVSADNSTFQFFGAASLVDAVAQAVREPTTPNLTRYIQADDSISGTVNPFVTFLMSPIGIGTFSSVEVWNRDNSVTGVNNYILELFIDGMSQGTQPGNNGPNVWSTNPLRGSFSAVSTIEVKVWATYPYGSFQTSAIYIRISDYFGPPPVPPPVIDVPITQKWNDVVAASHPVIWYKFNETNVGQSVQDSSGNELDGKYFAIVNFQEPPIVEDPGNSIFLFGDSSGVSVDFTGPTSSQPDPFNVSAVCFEFWFVWTSGNDQLILDFNNSTDDVDTQGKDFKLFLQISETETILHFRGSEVSLPHIFKNKRYYFVINIGQQTNSNVGFWSNGVKYPTGLSDDFSELGITLTNKWFAHGFIGTADEFLYYQRHLTDAEIAGHYISGTTFHDPTNTYTEIVEEVLVFNEQVYGQKVVAGGGTVHNMVISERLSFIEGRVGPPASQSVKEKLSFTESITSKQRPFRLKVNEQINFKTDKAHGSPNRQKISEQISFTEVANPHMFQPEVQEDIIFIEDAEVQNNHQYVTESINFQEDLNFRYAVSHQHVAENIEFVETPFLHYHIAHVTVTENILFVEMASKTYDMSVSETLNLTEILLHLFGDVTENLMFVETVDGRASKEIQETLTFIEILCVNGHWNRHSTETINFFEAVSFLINGPDDQRNGGGSPGGPGVSFVTTYRRAIFEEIEFKETIITDPPPNNNDCSIEVN